MKKTVLVTLFVLFSCYFGSTTADEITMKQTNGSVDTTEHTASNSSIHASTFLSQKINSRDNNTLAISIRQSEQTGQGNTTRPPNGNSTDVPPKPTEANTTDLQQPQVAKITAKDQATTFLAQTTKTTAIQINDDSPKDKSDTTTTDRPQVENANKTIVLGNETSRSTAAEPRVEESTQIMADEGRMVPKIKNASTIEDTQLPKATNGTTAETTTSSIQGGTSQSGGNNQTTLTSASNTSTSDPAQTTQNTEHTTTTSSAEKFVAQTEGPRDTTATTPDAASVDPQTVRTTLPNDEKEQLPTTMATVEGPKLTTERDVPQLSATTNLETSTKFSASNDLPDTKLPTVEPLQQTENDVTSAVSLLAPKKTDPSASATKPTEGGETTAGINTISTTNIPGSGTETTSTVATNSPRAATVAHTGQLAGDPHQDTTTQLSTSTGTSQQTPLTNDLTGNTLTSTTGQQTSTGNALASASTGDILVSTATGHQTSDTTPLTNTGDTFTSTTGQQTSANMLASTTTGHQSSTSTPLTNNGLSGNTLTSTTGQQTSTGASANSNDNPLTSTTTGTLLADNGLTGNNIQQTANNGLTDNTATGQQSSQTGQISRTSTTQQAPRQTSNTMSLEGSTDTRQRATQLPQGLATALLPDSLQALAVEQQARKQVDLPQQALPLREQTQIPKKPVQQLPTTRPGGDKPSQRLPSHTTSTTTATNSGIQQQMPDNRVQQGPLSQTHQMTRQDPAQYIQQQYPLQQGQLPLQLPQQMTMQQKPTQQMLQQEQPIRPMGLAQQFPNQQLAMQMRANQQLPLSQHTADLRGTAFPGQQLQFPLQTQQGQIQGMGLPQQQMFPGNQFVMNQMGYGGQQGAIYPNQQFVNQFANQLYIPENQFLPQLNQGIQFPGGQQRAQLPQQHLTTTTHQQRDPATYRTTTPVGTKRTSTSSSTTKTVKKSMTTTKKPSTGSGTGKASASSKTTNPSKTMRATTPTSSPRKSTKTATSATSTKPIKKVPIKKPTATHSTATTSLGTSQAEYVSHHIADGEHAQDPRLTTPHETENEGDKQQQQQVPENTNVEGEEQRPHENPQDENPEDTNDGQQEQREGQEEKEVPQEPNDAEGHVSAGHVAHNEEVDTQQQGEDPQHVQDEQNNNLHQEHEDTTNAPDDAQPKETSFVDMLGIKKEEPTTATTDPTADTQKSETEQPKPTQDEPKPTAAATDKPEPSKDATTTTTPKASGTTSTTAQPTTTTTNTTKQTNTTTPTLQGFDSAEIAEEPRRTFTLYLVLMLTLPCIVFIAIGAYAYSSNSSFTAIIADIKQQIPVTNPQTWDDGPTKVLPEGDVVVHSDGTTTKKKENKQKPNFGFGSGMSLAGRAKAKPKAKPKPRASPTQPQQQLNAHPVEDPWSVDESGSDTKEWKEGW